MECQLTIASEALFEEDQLMYMKQRMSEMEMKK